MDASADQTSALQSAVLDGQLTVAAADPTDSAASSATTSANAQRSASDNTPLGKLSDKSNGAASTASATDHADSAALSAVSPPSTGRVLRLCPRRTRPEDRPLQSAQSGQEVADRAADALRTGFDSGGELRIRLEPPALGKVQIEVQSDAGSVSARLEVQTPAARQTLLDNISMLHDAIGQTGATVGRIDIEVVPQQHQDSSGSDQRNGNSDGQQQNPGANSQDQSNNRGGTQQQNSNRGTAAIDELDIAI